MVLMKFIQGSIDKYPSDKTINGVKILELGGNLSDGKSRGVVVLFYNGVNNLKILKHLVSPEPFIMF